MALVLQAINPMKSKIASQCNQNIRPYIMRILNK